MAKKFNNQNIYCDTITHLFSSESVANGHPDKVADGISDSVLDAHLAVDRKSRVACETLVTTGLVMIAGEITSEAKINYAEVAREKIKRIGYTDGRKDYYYYCSPLIDDPKCR